MTVGSTQKRWLVVVDGRLDGQVEFDIDETAFHESLASAMADARASAEHAEPLGCFVFEVNQIAYVGREKKA